MGKLKHVIGIDEAGRGPWAGPLVAAAVCLPPDCQIDEITDSKLMSPRKRERALRQIQQRALAVGIGWAMPAAIDEYGLNEATTSAMRTAWQQLNSVPSGAEVLIDGNVQYLHGVQEARAIPGGDRLEPAISAASIVAKVFRDKFMHRQADIFPVYGFETHVGYGTERHRQALAAYGVCDLHRQSFAPIRSLTSK